MQLRAMFHALRAKEKGFSSITEGEKKGITMMNEKKKEKKTLLWLFMSDQGHSDVCVFALEPIFSSVFFF